jgi:hypothetical protein
MLSALRYIANKQSNRLPAKQVPSKYRASTEQAPSKYRASTEQAPSKSLKSELKSSLNIVQLQGKEVKCRLSWDLLIENTLENHPATIA